VGTGCVISSVGTYVANNLLPINERMREKESIFLKYRAVRGRTHKNAADASAATAIVASVATLIR